MGPIRDSSELREAARLLDEFLKPVPHPAAGTSSDESPPLPAVPETVRREDADDYKACLPGYGENVREGTRLERIEAALELMCIRGGFGCAVLVGTDGFIVASWNLDHGEPEIAGLCTMLSDSIRLMSGTFGGVGDEPAAVRKGDVTAGVSVIGPEDARFVLAGFSDASEPDLSELGAAASYIGSLLG